MQYRILNINDISKKEYDIYYSMMSESKKQKVDRLRFTDDKKRTVAGELLARKMIEERCNVSVENIVFNQNAYGKPYTENLNVEFNISHSGDFVVCGVSDKPIGVDIEKIRHIESKIISFVCTEEELAYVNEKVIEIEEQQKRFFRIWTFKEAYLKCLGTGITDIKSVNYFDKTKTRFNHIEAPDGYIITFYNL